MKRVEFSKRVKLEAFQRSGGRCEICTGKLSTGHIEYDHVIPLALGGSSDINNICCTCRSCHDLKTFGKDIPAVAKSNRIRAKHLGIRRHSSRPMPGSRASGIRKRMNGNVERW